MAYLSYDTQSSHQGYIDMEFKEICSSPNGHYDNWLHNGDLFEAVTSGCYVEEDVFIPKYMREVFEWEGDYTKARVSKRLVKVWCTNVGENCLDYKNNNRRNNE